MWEFRHHFTMQTTQKTSKLIFSPLPSTPHTWNGSPPQRFRQKKGNPGNPFCALWGEKKHRETVLETFFGLHKKNAILMPLFFWDSLWKNKRFYLGLKSKILRLIQLQAVSFCLEKALWSFANPQHTLRLRVGSFSETRTVADVRMIWLMDEIRLSWWWQLNILSKSESAWDMICVHNYISHTKINVDETWSCTKNSPLQKLSPKKCGIICNNWICN